MKLAFLGGMSLLLLSAALVPAAKAAETIGKVSAPRVPMLSTTSSGHAAGASSNLYAPRAYQAVTQNSNSTPQRQVGSSISQSNVPATRYHYVTGQFAVTNPQSQAMRPEWETSQSRLKELEGTTKITQMRQPFFAAGLQLTRSNATQKGTFVASTYEFTVRVPENAGEPLKAVRISQIPGLETVKFDLNRSKAFAGDRFAAGPEIPVASIGGTEQPGEVTIVFDQSVQPGNTVTIALETNANPNWDGVYQFGITAFPRAENGLGQFLGYGRISIYGNSN